LQQLLSIVFFRHSFSGPPFAVNPWWWRWWCIQSSWVLRARTVSH